MTTTATAAATSRAAAQTWSRVSGPEGVKSLSLAGCRPSTFCLTKLSPSSIDAALTHPECFCCLLLPADMESEQDDDEDDQHVAELEEQLAIDEEEVRRCWWSCW